MKNLLTVSFLVVLIFSFCDARSSDFKTDSLTIEDGLTFNAVTSILKDSQGFMWFGTKMGLNRYDGYNIKTYIYDNTNPGSLSENRIHDICEDRDGNLWIATKIGLNKFDKAKEIFIHFISNPDDSATLSNNDINAVFEDSYGTIWAGTRSGLNRFDKENEIFYQYKNDPKDSTSLSGDWINVISEDNEGTLWIGAWPGGLNRYNRNSDNFSSFLAEPDSLESHSNAITSIYEDKKGNFWIGTWEGIYQFNRKKEIFSRNLYETGNPDNPDDQTIAAFCEDKSGNYWLKTLEGLYLYSAELKKLNKWQHKSDNKIFAAWLSSKSLYPDESGTLWYCQHYRGIHKITNCDKKFRKINNNPVGKLLNEYINTLYVENNDIIWMGGREGLTRYNRKSNEYEFYQSHPEQPGISFDNRIYCIVRDKDSTLWVGMRNGLNKVEIINKNSAKFTPYYPLQYKEEIKDSITVRNLFEDHMGKVFVSLGSSDHIYIFDSEKEYFVQLVDSLNNPVSGSVIFEEESGDLWISYNRKGLLKMTPPFKKVTQNTITPTKTVHYKAESRNSRGPNVNYIDDLYKAHTGTIWLGTFGGGLNKLERKKDESTGEIIERFFYYTTQDGLPSDAVSSITEDKYGNLWLGSENGLTKFNPTTEVFKNYDKSDGLWTLDITGKCYCSSWGEMFITSNDGVIAFYPDSIRDNSQIPPLVITDFRLFNKPVSIGENSPLKKSITAAEEIELPFNKNSFSFEFAALNYINADKNQYKYRMDGLDDDWIEVGTRRSAEYHKLNPGSYIFRVIGSNDDGVWNTEGASIKVIIHPPWWRTIYAYSAYLIITLLLIFGYVRLRTHQLEKEKSKLEKKVKERTQKIEEHERKIEELGRVKTRFFTNVSHEFRTPLTLIQGPVDELMENERLSVEVHKKLNMVQRNARRLLGLVNQLLDVSKVESGKMKLVLGKGDIFETLRVIAGSFSSMAEAKGIIYNRHIPNIKKQIWYDAEMVEKIVVNLLSNAFKFSPESGEVSFKAELVESEKYGVSEVLEFSVSDQGPGIPADSQDKIFDRFYQEENSVKKMSAGTGIGLSLTRDLVDLNHGEIRIESEPGKGSTFTVKFPLGKDHLNESEYVFSEKEKEPVCMEPEIVSLSSEAFMSDQEETVPDKQSEKPIILIVEDNRDIRTHIRENFEKEYCVMEARDGSAGLKKATDILPDLIITDLMMPKMDGKELCHQIKNDERTSHIPVIMLTARNTLDDKLEGLETGADDYIAKPFQMKELKARVHNLIEQRRKLRERFSGEITVEPRDITVNSFDEEFLKRAISTVENYMSDENFDINTFQKELNMSHSTLYRKLFSLTNLSPSGFIRSIRIKRAAQLIKQHYGNIAKISYEVGFNNPSYFSKCFKEIIGISPAEYSKN